MNTKEVGFVKAERMYDLHKVVKKVNYKGEFTLDYPSKVCPTSGNIKLSIFKDTNKIKGFYKVKDKKYPFETMLNGQVINGTTNNLTFFGKLSNDSLRITGEYFNQKCKGSFTLQRNNN